MHLNNSGACTVKSVKCSVTAMLRVRTVQHCTPALQTGTANWHCKSRASAGVCGTRVQIAEKGNGQRRLNSCLGAKKTALKEEQPKEDQLPPVQLTGRTPGMSFQGKTPFSAEEAAACAASTTHHQGSYHTRAPHRCQEEVPQQRRTPHEEHAGLRQSKSTSQGAPSA